MEQWIEEVLFRGRPPSGPGSEGSPRLHVIIGLQDDDPLTPGQKVRKTVGPMDMKSAETLGYTPLGLVEKINFDLAKRILELEAELESKSLSNS